MKVQELIDKLNSIQDKSREVTVYMSTGDPSNWGVVELIGFPITIEPKGFDNSVEIVSAALDIRISEGFEDSEECSNGSQIS